MVFDWKSNQDHNVTVMRRLPVKHDSEWARKEIFPDFKTPASHVKYLPLYPHKEKNPFNFSSFKHWICEFLAPFSTRRKALWIKKDGDFNACQSMRVKGQILQGENIWLGWSKACACSSVPPPKWIRYDQVPYHTMVFTFWNKSRTIILSIINTVYRGLRGV